MGSVSEEVVPMSKERRDFLKRDASEKMNRKIEKMCITGEGNTQEIERLHTLTLFHDVERYPSCTPLLDFPVDILTLILEYTAIHSDEYDVVEISRVCKLFRKILFDKDTRGCLHRIHLMRIDSIFDGMYVSKLSHCVQDNIYNDSIIKFDALHLYLDPTDNIHTVQATVRSELFMSKFSTLVLDIGLGYRFLRDIIVRVKCETITFISHEENIIYGFKFKSIKRKGDTYIHSDSKENIEKAILCNSQLTRSNIQRAIDYIQNRYLTLGSTGTLPTDIPIVDVESLHPVPDIQLPEEYM